jgi:hypothetical protein
MTRVNIALDVKTESKAQGSIPPPRKSEQTGEEKRK